jgi:hypothetical protein
VGVVLPVVLVLPVLPARAHGAGGGAHCRLPAAAAGCRLPVLPALPVVLLALWAAHGTDSNNNAVDGGVSNVKPRGGPSFNNWPPV